MISIWHKATWRKQLLFILIGFFFVSVLGLLLMPGTGAGSSRILHALLAIYALLLLIFGPKFTKVTGLILLCVFLLAFAISTQNRIRFGEKMKQRIEEKHTSKLKKGEN